MADISFEEWLKIVQTKAGSSATGSAQGGALGRTAYGGQLIHTLLNAVHIFSPIVHEWALLDMITSLLKGGGGNLGFREQQSTCHPGR